MKVLHVIDSGGMYGAETVLLNLVQEQVKLGLQAEIASIGEWGIIEKPLEQEARSRGFNVSEFRMRPGPNPVGAVRLRNHAKRNGFDILHSHGYKGNILLGAMLPVFRRLPLVSTLHGYTSTGGMSKMGLYEWLDRKMLSRLDAVVLVSETMRDHPKLAGIKGLDFHVIHNGIPLVRNNGDGPSGTLDHKIKDFCVNGFIIGAVGRFSHEKGFHTLIDAFASVARQAPDPKLLILGDGGLRHELEMQVSSLELEERVFMPGYVQDAAGYMTLFNVFVLSSLTEGLPMTLLEAMQCCLPIVSTRVGGMISVLRHEENGLLVDPYDPKALAEALMRVYSDGNLRTKLGREAGREVRKKHSSELMASEYLDLYREVLQKQKGTFA